MPGRHGLRWMTPAFSLASPLFTLVCLKDPLKTRGLFLSVGRLLATLGAFLGRDTHPEWELGTPRPPTFRHGTCQECTGVHWRTPVASSTLLFFSYSCLKVTLKSLGSVSIYRGTFCHLGVPP